MLRLRPCHLFIAATLSYQLSITELLFPSLNLFEIPKDAFSLIYKAPNVMDSLESGL